MSKAIQDSPEANQHRQPEKDRWNARLSDYRFYDARNLPPLKAMLRNQEIFESNQHGDTKCASYSPDLMLIRLP